MKISVLSFLAFIACAAAFSSPEIRTARTVVARNRAMPQQTARVTPTAQLDLKGKDLQTAAVQSLPALAVATAAMPAHAQEMSAAFLPAILTPLVGIVFPGFAMILFFIYADKN